MLKNSAGCTKTNNKKKHCGFYVLHIKKIAESMFDPAVNL